MSVKEDYKIQSFDPETQNLLKTALKGTAIIPTAIRNKSFSHLRVYSTIMKIVFFIFFSIFTIVVFTM